MIIVLVYFKDRSSRMPIYVWNSCGTVALDGLITNFFFLADHRATDFTLSKICGTPTKNRSHDF